MLNLRIFNLPCFSPCSFLLTSSIRLVDSVTRFSFPLPQKSKREMNLTTSSLNSSLNQQKKENRIASCLTESVRKTGTDI